MKLHSYIVKFTREEDPFDSRFTYCVASSPKEASEIVKEILTLRGRHIVIVEVKSTRTNFIAKTQYKNKEEFYRAEQDELYRLKHHIKKGEIL